MRGWVRRRTSPRVQGRRPGAWARAPQPRRGWPSEAPPRHARTARATAARADGRARGRDVSRVFCEFLEVAVHQILFIRGVYPAELFERKRCVRPRLRGSTRTRARSRTRPPQPCRRAAALPPLRVCVCARRLPALAAAARFPAAHIPRALR